MAITDTIQNPNLSGPYLRNVRYSLGLSKKYAAGLIGCSESTLARYESEGIRGTTEAQRIADICKAYVIRTQTVLDCAMVPIG